MSQTKVIEMISEVLRDALESRGYRTDGDIAILADRCRYMAAEDRDLINMQKTLIHRYRGEPPEADREDVRLPRARDAWDQKWPDELTSGVMFYDGLRITRQQFERGIWQKDKP